jgi:hypothetical protein
MKKHAQGVSFQPNARLGLIVKLTTERADVCINAHHSRFLSHQCPTGEIPWQLNREAVSQAHSQADLESVKSGKIRQLSGYDWQQKTVETARGLR